MMSAELSDEALFLVQDELRAGAQAVNLVVVSEITGRYMEFACKTCTIH